MQLSAMKARSGWLFSFADMVTLLITFFIMMIVLNKGEITRLQKWSEVQLDRSYDHLSQQLNATALDDMFVLQRETKGLTLDLRHPEAFVRGGYALEKPVADGFEKLAGLLENLPVLASPHDDLPPAIRRYVEKEHYKWVAAIRIEGHTDQSRIDPRSALRNNWFLSSMRAQSVRTVMAENSTLAPWLAISGYGAQRPIRFEKSAEAQALNRRVTLTISAGFEKERGKEPNPESD